MAQFLGVRSFGNDADGKHVRNPRASAFRDFSEHIRAAKLTGVDPLERCSTTQMVQIGDQEFAFVTLNTALFSDAARSDEGIAPAPVAALRAELQNIARSVTPIVVGHHPIGWFSHITQEPFRTALLEAGAIYIHGHLHQVRVSHSVRGLESIGFGAVYPGPLDVKADAYYENAFAICEYHDALHVKVCSWDGVHGRWQVSNRLPADFHVVSDTLPGGFRFTIPGNNEPKARRATEANLTAARRPPRPSSLIALEILGAKAWWNLLILMGEVDSAEVAPSIASAGEVEFRTTSSHGVHVIRCISGQGRIISVRELEAENTRLDTGEHDSITIVNFGRAEEAARQLATKLGRKKPFKLLCNDDIAAAVGARWAAPAGQHLATLDLPDSSLAFVVDDAGLSVVVLDGSRGAWFYVICADGSYAQESSHVVRRIRETLSSVARASYQPPGELFAPPPPSGAIPAFDRDAYLMACSAEFDEVKYAPLAALGFRFPKAKLMDIYVPATAELGDHGSPSQQLRQALDDFIDGMNLDEATRAQIRAHFEERFFKGMREGGAARAFYQQHRNVLVLGDPGSGKTCFVKHEILSYCRPPSEGGSWYELHTPVFVPLSEAAPLLKEDEQLLGVCATVSARRGLTLSSTQLESLAANGHLAFFLDGLDEVPSMEQRSRLMRAISAAAADLVPLGNRFVLTSRPAALEALQPPAELVELHLRHLSQEQIRLLANKILAIQLTEEGSKIGFEANAVTDASIVDRLLADCTNKPGIGRLARNPLLLSLLVMIYANSGAPSAKKHRIYAQAVQTLVSVRNRVAGMTVLSESDLRRRLGAVALAIYEEQLPELPTRDDTVRIIEQVIAREQSGGDARSLADEFVKRVAEGTGLLSLHQTSQTAGLATVTFMHHSFLEYYAATALVGERDVATIPVLAESRRWREVVSLAAGMIGDQADVAPLIEELLKARRPGDEITQTQLLFAFDCALECDVPAERAQSALASELARTMSQGAGRVDGSFRGELADRIARLWDATGSKAILECLRNGLVVEDHRVVGAYVDLIGRIGSHGQLPSEIVKAVEGVAARREGAVRIALYGAAGRCSELRSDLIQQAIREGMKESFAVKLAATRALEDAPSLAKKEIEALKIALDDPQLPIAAAAARAILESGVSITSPNHADRLLVEKCLRRWEQLAEPRSSAKISIRAQREEVDRMLSSPTEEERVLAIRLLPWLERQEAYTHERLFEIVSIRRSSAEVVGALASLRLSAGAAALCSSRDIDSLIGLMESHANSRDIRIAAIRALAVVPPAERVVSALLDRCRHTSQAEFRESLRALTTSAPGHPQVRDFVAETLRDGLAGPLKDQFGKPAKQGDLRRVMRVATELGVLLPELVGDALVTVAENFKAPAPIREQSIRTYARCAPVTMRGLQQVEAWLKSHTAPFEALGPSVVSEFLRRARQRVDDVRKIFPALPSLESTLIAEWDRKRPDRARFIDDFAYRGVRTAVRELRDIRAAFSEFDRRGASEAPREK